MLSANLFMEILDRSSAYDVLFDHASPATVYRIGWTCWMARRAVQDYSRRAFNINKHLRRFFDDPIGFRNLQARTGTLISSVFAYRFLNRTACGARRIDLYIYPQHAVDVGKWVMEKGGKGYRFIPMDGQHEDFDVAATTRPEWSGYWGEDAEWDIDLGRIQNLLKFVTNEDIEKGSSLMVRMLVGPGGCSPFQTLLVTAWHSTAFMNVITFFAAFSSYPFATFEDRKSLAMDYTEELPNIDRCLGIDVVHIIDALKHRPSKSLMVRERHVDDEMSWVILFDMRGVSWPKVSPNNPRLPLDPLSVNWEDMFDDPRRPTRPTTMHWEIDHELFNVPSRSWWSEVDLGLKGIVDTLLRSECAKRLEYPDQEHWTWFDEVLSDYKVTSMTVLGLGTWVRVAS